MSEWSLTPSGKHFPLTSPQSVSMGDVQLSDARNEANIENAFTPDSSDNDIIIFASARLGLQCGSVYG